MFVDSAHMKNFISVTRNEENLMHLLGNKDCPE